MAPTLAQGMAAVEVSPRTPRPVRRLDLLAALSAAVAACALYVAALFVTTLPPPGLSVVLFAAAPLCACFALPVLQVRAKAEDVPALSWVAGGLLVAVVAMTLQLISFVAVSPAGGPLGTDGQSRSGLFLLYHGASQWARSPAPWGSTRGGGCRWSPSAWR